MINTKPFVFNPDEEPRELLIATFVIRQTIYQKIFKGIKEASRTTPPQHFLLVGQRGMGKTTLLLRVKYAVEDDAELNHYILVIRFPEEQYNIANLPDLWEETARYMENMDSAFEGILDELEEHEKKDDYERIAFDLISSKLKQQNKRILFLIDNVGDLLKKFTDQENHRLREILMTSPHLQLLGASSEMLEYNFQYDKPFFEFFYLLKLQPLNKKEAVDLMKTLAANYGVTDKIEAILNNTPERVEVLRRITGGVPRTLVLLFQIFVDYNDGSAFEDLEHLVDKVLPLYKARMDSLKPQQQKIIDALARAWEAIPSADILEQSKLYREGITSNQISSQLKQLEDNQLVEVVDVGKRKKLYRIRERFFNIWYLMRNGRKQNKEQVLWLIRFLESWCTVEELRDIARNQIKSLESGSYSEKAAYYKAMALHHIACIDTVTKQKLLEITENFLLRTKRHEWANNIHNLLEESNSNWRIEAYEAHKKGNVKKAESIQLKAFKEGKIGASYSLGLFYKDILGDYKKAKYFFENSIMHDNSINALNSLALLYWRNLDNKEEAEKLFLQAIEKGHIDAVFNLAYFYDEAKKDFIKSETLYLKSIELGSQAAIFNLAQLYKERGYNEKAKEYYIKAIDAGNSEALNNLAVLYENNFKDFENAEKYYLEAAKKGYKDAMFNLGLFYENIKKENNSAEKYYLQAIEHDAKDAIINLANFYVREKRDYDKAEALYFKAIQEGQKLALNNLGVLYDECKNDYKKAEEMYLKAIESGDRDAVGNVGFLYYHKLNNISKAEQYFLQAFYLGDFRVVGYIISLYWENKKRDKALKFCAEVFNNESFFLSDLSIAFEIVISLLSEGQYYFLLQELKKDNSLLMKYQHPIYYAVAWYLKDELPGEYEKAGSEIKETVDEIIKAVEERKAAEAVDA